MDEFTELLYIHRIILKLLLGLEQTKYVNATDLTDEI